MDQVHPTLRLRSRHLLLISDWIFSTPEQMTPHRLLQWRASISSKELINQEAITKTSKTFAESDGPCFGALRLRPEV